MDHLTIVLAVLAATALGAGVLITLLDMLDARGTDRDRRGDEELAAIL